MNIFYWFLIPVITILASVLPSHSLSFSGLNTSTLSTLSSSITTSLSINTTTLSTITTTIPINQSNHTIPILNPGNTSYDTSFSQIQQLQIANGDLNLTIVNSMLPYGAVGGINQTRQPAGNDVYYPYQLANKTLYVYNVIVAKAMPPLSINIKGLGAVSGANIRKIQLPDINGYIIANFTLNASLIQGNTAPFNYTIRFVNGSKINGTYSTRQSINVPLSIKVKIPTQDINNITNPALATISFESAGDSNYSLLDPTGILTASPNGYTVSNTIIKIGQYSTFNTVISGGLGAYIGNWSWTPIGVSFGNVIGSTGTGTWNTVNTITTGVTLYQCLSFNSYIYCGGDFNGGASATVQSVQIFSGTNAIGTWGTTNSLAAALDNNQCVAYSGYMYCPGGNSGGITTKVQSAVIYPGTNSIGTWGTTNSLITGVDENSCVGYSGYIYCPAGLGSSNPTASVQSAPIFAGTNVIGTWTTTNALPLTLYGNPCVASYGYIYCMGGFASVSQYLSANVFSAQIYPGTNVIGVWGTTNALPIGLGVSGCNVWNTYIYCFGGFSGSNLKTIYYAQIYLGTPIIGVWQTSTNSLKTAAQGPSCPNYNGYVYCFGGNGATASQSANILSQEITPNQPLQGVSNAITLTIQAVSNTQVNVIYQGTTYPVFASGTNTIFGTWAFNAFVQDSGAINSILVTNTITIVGYTPPTVSIGNPSNSIVDTGQYQSFLATITGGTPNYQYTFNAVNSVSASTVTNTATFTGVSGVTQLWTYYINAQDPSNSQEQANVFIVDSNPTFTNSIYSSKYTINPQFKWGTWNVPTQSAIGNIQRLTANVVGGTQGYTYNFLVYNPSGALTFNYLIYNALPSNVFAFIQSGVAGTWTANIIVNDSATSNAQLTNSIQYTVNQALATPTLTFSNTPIIDIGEYETLSAYATGGITPYTYNFLVYNSVTNALIFNSLQTTNSVTYLPIAGNTFYANVFITDSYPTTVNSILTPIVSMNPPLTIPSITPTISVSYDGQQIINFNAFVSGGITPYTYNFLVYNSVTNIQIGNLLTTSNSFAFTGFPTNSIYGNVIVTDSGNMKTNSILSAVIGINTILGIPTLTPSITGTIFTGETESWKATLPNGNTGSGAYTYNFLVYNSITNILVANSLQVGVSSTSATFSNTIPGGWVGNTIYANVFITDSATPPNTVNSILTGSILIRKAQATTGSTIFQQNITYNEYITLTTLFIIISLILFLLAIIRFPLGSFQNIILLVLAALTMYLATSFYSIVHITSIANNPNITISASGTNTVINSYNTSFYSAPTNAKVNQLYWDFTIIYDLVCIAFALLGLLIRFYRSV